MSIFIFKKIGGGNSLKALLLALLLSVAGLMNAQQFTVGNLNYAVNSDGVSVRVTGHVDGTSATGALNIPGTVTYNGKDYTVTEIGDQAFKCSGLTSLTLPNSLKFIGSNAFWSCTSITSITIPNSVTSIGADAFLETGWWNNQPNGVVYKDNCCLGYKGAEPTGHLAIAEGTRLIQGQAFVACHDLTSLTLPNSLKAIGGYAFSGCTGITTINIPNSVTLIGIYAFYNTGWWNSQPNGIVYKDNCCLGYKGNKPTGALQIADGTRLIVTSAFNNCYDLTSVSLPNSLDVLCNYAFYGCSGLTSIESLASTPPILYEYSFGDVNHSIPVTVPHGTLAAYQSAPYWSEFTHFVEAGGSVTTIGEIRMNGFTVPAWGAHPDFELELPSDAHCTVSYTAWYRVGAGGSSFSSMTSGAVFDCENCDYYMEVVLEPESGYAFADHPKVYFNGNASVFDASSSHILTDGRYKAFTIDYQVSPSIPSYTLTVMVTPAEAGTVSGGGTYAAGTSVKVKAIPSAGFVFKKWNDNVTDNPRTVVVNNNMTLEAVFSGVGVDETGETPLSLYPNPANETIRIEGLEASATVEIYNSLGMRVKTITVTTDEEINVSDLAPGVYMLRCGKQTISFVKK